MCTVYVKTGVPSIPGRVIVQYHARKAEKLMTLTAMPAYDPIIRVSIILIISC